MEGQKTLTKEEKRKSWNYAIGMMQVDGVKPDAEYLELVEKEINGEITLDEMELIILKQYDETGRYQ
ncbi:antitoxin VbhA family protein [bacterium]|nr:antitoxin VbhA family protein [bacterium]